MPHQNLSKLCKTNTTLPSIMKPKCSTKSCLVMFGELLNIHHKETCLVKRHQIAPQNISFQDKFVHAEAKTVSFLAEQLPLFTLAPKLFGFAQKLVKDLKVLESLSLSKDTTSYKLKEGLATLLFEDLVRDLQCNFFFNKC